MLISYTISNFLSFDSKQTISMVAGAPKKKADHCINKGKIKILKFAELYGANASGKSNLIKAVAFFKKIVLEGVKTNWSNCYYRGKKDNKDKLSTFDFEFEIDNKIYTYGFDILLSKNSIRAERLYELKPEKDDILIFNRTTNGDIKLNENYFDSDTLYRLNIYYSDIKSQDNILFLTLMNINKDSLYEENPCNSVIIFRKVFNWFLNSLVVIFPDVYLDNSKFFISNQKINEINSLISKFGTGISECKMIDCQLDELQSKLPPAIFNNLINQFEKFVSARTDEKNPRASIRLNKDIYFLSKKGGSYQLNKIVFEHRNDEGSYEFYEESDGTQRLFDLIQVLMDDGFEKVYFIDELNRCFHPDLSLEFVKSFFAKTTNSQLIVTTHEIRLLDLDLLRRDEIWFCERKSNGPTNLYSLEEFGERFDRKIDKAYLDGRYGGIPFFNNYFA